MNILEAGAARIAGTLAAWFVEPLFEDSDFPLTRRRKAMFALASMVSIACNFIYIVAVFIESDNHASPCGWPIAFTGLAGLCVTAFFYTYCRLERECRPCVLGLQIGQISLQPFVVAVYSVKAAAFPGTLGPLMASLVFAACRMEITYHALAVVPCFLTLSLSITGVDFSVGPIHTFCQESSARLSAVVSAASLAQFYVIAALASFSLFLESFREGELRDFFSLRMADAVLGFIASVDTDTAEHALCITKGFVSPDVHTHFDRIVETLKRYKEFLPSSLFAYNGGTRTGARNSVQVASEQHQGNTDGPSPLTRKASRSMNPLMPLRSAATETDPEMFINTSAASSALQCVVPHRAGTSPEAETFGSMDGDERRRLSVLEYGLEDPHGPGEQFLTRRGTVMRISFNQQDRRNISIDEALTFRRTMEEIVSAVEDSAGEIEEATSTFVLVSFGARFPVITHEQNAADCALRIYDVLGEMYKYVHIAIASGLVHIGTFSGDNHVWVVIGGTPIDIVRKLNSLQQQIHSGVVVTSEVATRVKQVTVPVDICRPAGFDVFVVFELITFLNNPAVDWRPEVRSAFQAAVSALQRGNSGVSEAILHLQPHEAVNLHALRLLRVLRVLPKDMPYVKDEIPWIDTLDEPIAPAKDMTSSGVGQFSGLSQDVPAQTPAGYLEPSLLTVGLHNNWDTTSMSSVGTGARRFAGGVDEGYYAEINVDSWTLRDEAEWSGRSSEVSLALGSQGTLAAGVRIDNVSEDMLRDVCETCGRMMQANIVRVFGIHVLDDRAQEDQSHTSSCLLLTAFYPMGSMKQYLLQYGPIKPKAWVNFTRDIVRGACYLSANNVVHGCIRPSCILLSEDGSCALTKFGLSPPHTSSPEHVFYAAPELITGDDTECLTSACDVWSIGITCMELLGYRHPLYDVCEEGAENYHEWFRHDSDGSKQHHLTRRVRDLMMEAPPSIIEFVVMCLVIRRVDRHQAVDLARTVDNLISE